jgi:NADPH:quinone reductase-like Zn-dependent oxidoreductase
MPKVIAFDRFGGPEVLYLIDQPVIEPAADEVRIRIEAFALNPLDAMMRSGTSPAPVDLPGARLGIEGTGVVDAVGDEVKGLAVGDDVIISAIPNAIARGSYAKYTTLPASDVFKRPDGLDTVQAAAIWVGFSTAYGALIEGAGMRRGDRVLITAASGAVGRAAIQIANRVGALPIAITRSKTRVGALLASGATKVITTDSHNIVDEVQRETGGAGVDIVLDLVKGPGQQDLLQATREDGTLVVAGFLDPRPTLEPGDVKVRIITHRGFSFLADPAAVSRAVTFLEAGVRDGALLPEVDETYDLTEIVDAHRRFDAGLHQGKKIVVTV